MRTKKIIYVDMDGVLCDFEGAHVKYKEKYPGLKYPQSQYDFFRKLEAIEGGMETVKYLHTQVVFDVYFLSAPSVMNPLSYTEKRLWIEDYFGLEMAHRLILSPNKGLNKGDYLIDDYNYGKGQENFEGKLIKFGSEEFPDWEKVLAYFMKRYDL